MAIVNLANIYGTPFIYAPAGLTVFNTSYLNDNNYNTIGWITWYTGSAPEVKVGYSQVILSSSLYVNQIYIQNMRFALNSGSASIDYTLDGNTWINLQSGITQASNGVQYSYGPYNVNTNIKGVRVTFSMRPSGVYGAYQYEVGEIVMLGPAVAPSNIRGYRNGFLSLANDVDSVSDLRYYKNTTNRLALVSPGQGLDSGFRAYNDGSSYGIPKVNGT